jgi:Sensors of blue-light using FAD
VPFAQLIYCSRTRLPEDKHQDELASILDTAMWFNRQNEITGCLGHSRDWFVQVIEGPESAVAETYGRIAQDRRHSDVRKLLTREIRNRSFPEWSMMSVTLDDAIAAVPGGNTLSPETTPPLQLLMGLMNAADARRMKR